MFNLLGSHDTERILTRCKEDSSKLKQLLAIQYVFPGNPTVYYGDELGMIGENDPGCRGSMPWDSLEEPAAKAFFKEHQAWISRKVTNPVLQSGSLELKYKQGSDCYVIRRYNDTEDVVLLMNFSEDCQNLSSVMSQFELTGNYSIYGEEHLGQLPEVIEPGQYIIFQTVQ
ncbi:Cyclomaltodextrinase [compost metagenome]